MTSQDIDLTIEELLSDPLFRAANQADRVDAGAFERLLRSTAARMPAGRDQSDRVIARRSALLACLCAAQSRHRGVQGGNRSW